MNEPQTDTPKTYAEINWASEYDPDCEVVSAELSSKLEKELAAVTEQRDQYKAALQSADNHNHEIATKLEIVTEQRDEACKESIEILLKLMDVKAERDHLKTERLEMMQQLEYLGRFIGRHGMTTAHIVSETVSLIEGLQKQVDGAKHCLTAIQENRHLKDMLANLSKTHATNMQRLSDIIDKRQEALHYISEIIEEKAAEREDLKIGSTAYKSVRRWASLFLHVTAQTQKGRERCPDNTQD